MSIHDYTGKAYDFATYNCWDHVRAVRAYAGIETPDFDCSSPADVTDAIEHGREIRKGLVLVSTPRNYDAVLMKFKSGGRADWHAGVYVDGIVSHCDMRARQVRIDPLDELVKRCKRVEFWR